MLFGGVLLGVSLYPAVLLWQAALPWGAPGQALALGLGYFLTGACLLFWCAAVHTALGARLKPGSYPLLSWPAFQWSVASALYMLVKYTFADLLASTPLFKFYLRALGLRLGHGVMINSKFLHDHSLLQLEDGVLIGGDAVLSAHTVEKSHLVLKPIRVRRGALIGQKSILMPGVEVGERAVVAAGAVVLKDTVIGPGEVWAGVPARLLKTRSEEPGCTP